MIDVNKLVVTTAGRKAIQDMMVGLRVRVTDFQIGPPASEDAVIDIDKTQLDDPVLTGMLKAASGAADATTVMFTGEVPPGLSGLHEFGMWATVESKHLVHTSAFLSLLRRVFRRPQRVEVREDKVLFAVGHVDLNKGEGFRVTLAF